MRVAHELTTLYLQHGPYVLVHGACATGADAAAHHWYETAGADLGCTEVQYPADWEQFGKRAGPLRNAQMVKTGANLVLAFPLSGGKGTQMTIEFAREAGIEVREITP